MIGQLLLERYKILSEIGEGGMSSVFLAEHVMLKRKYAVKMLADHLLKTPGFKERFFKEGLAQAQLQHDNIVQVIDYIEEGDKTFLLMDYIEGDCLDSLIHREKILSESKCIQIMTDVLDALNFAHLKGVIHRDIKPSNIIISNTGKSMLMDFGIAIMMGDKRMTATGTNIGTSWYMSPEHVTRPREIDHRSDVYSMGIVLYEMLTGDVPFDGETDYEIKDSHVRKAVVPPIEKNPSISMEMNNIVLKALSKKPDDRFDGCAEFLGYIKALKNEKLEEAVISNKSDNTIKQKKTEVEEKPQFKKTEIEKVAENEGKQEIIKEAVSKEKSYEQENNQSTKSTKTPSELEPGVFFKIIGSIITCIVLILFVYAGNIFYKNFYKDKQEKPSKVITQKQEQSIKKHSQNDAARKKSFTNSLGMTFVLIPAGSFMMGSPDNESYRSSDEKQHNVTLSNDYYLQTTEVTQGQWKEIMGNNPSYFKNCGYDCPVEYVSWNDVQKFIDKLNRKEGINKYRLPTEAEWEYAARAGSKKAFSNGDISEEKCGYDSNLDKIAWYCGNSCVDYSGGNNCSDWSGKSNSCSKCGTHPIGKKQKNSWGIYGMYGNVAEWCQDWYDGYKSGSNIIDPTGPSSGSYRVIRGGAWLYGARDCRSADRYDNSPGNSSNDVGFRLFRTP